MINHRLALFFFLLAVLNPAKIFSQDVSPKSAEARIRADISILASDSLRGREAGTMGEQMASAYIADQMQKIGLLPRGDAEGSYLSEFRMNFPVLFKEATLRINDIEFKHIEEFGATDLSAPGRAEAQLINIGKSISVPDNEIAGRIVVMDIANGWKKADNETVLAEITTRVKSLIDKGVVGIILHNSSRKTTEDVLFGSPFTVAFGIPVVYIARLPYNKIRKIKTALCSLSVEIDRTVSKPANVIGWINNKSSKTVVIGAHYDHVGITKGKGTGPEPQIHNGADDNASGTAALLELARWAAECKSLKYNYIFVAFSAEEKGLFGSKAFCSRSWVNNKNILYMLNMDMVGRLGCQGDTISILGVASSPVWEKQVDGIEHPYFALKKISGAPPFSDHAPFLKKGIPVIYFTTGIHPDYHTPKDDTDLINFKGMAEIVEYIRLNILAAERLPEIPFHKISPVQHTKAYFQTF